jgi:hypothetical protein
MWSGGRLMKKNNSLDVSVLFLVYNRPDTTVRVMETIRKVKPARLFVAADGPRPGDKRDADKCRRVREIIRTVDWDCESSLLLRRKNLGCRAAVSSAINWFFRQVEEGVIIEDDCLPDPSFFSFCRELLAYYRDDNRVMHIGGNNFQHEEVSGGASYYFSRYGHIWGWATWRRAWKYYDVAMSTLPVFLKQGMLGNIFPRKFEQAYWQAKLKRIREQNIDLWDFQWHYTLWAQGGLSIVPRVNMVSNIGIGKNATHTKRCGFDDMNVQGIPEIRHPRFVLPDRKKDDSTFNIVWA